MKQISVWTVARFEFMRYFKWKHELFNIAIIAVLFLISSGGGALMQIAKKQQHFEVAVIGHENLNLPLGDIERLSLLRANADEETARSTDVDTERLDGLLILRDKETAELIVNREPSWRKELELHLQKARLQWHLQEHAIDKTQFEHWQKPVNITLEYSEHAKKPASTRSSGIANALTIFGMIGVMTSFALFFVSITTEKQQRVSELVVSAIPHQTWMDGKLLGLTGHGLKAMLTMATYGLIFYVLFTKFSGNQSNLDDVLSIKLVLLTLLFSVAGLLFWNTVMAAIAASIDDPNSSTRSSFMMLPMIGAMMVFPGIDAPENIMMRVLSWLPFTSMNAMPVRLAHGTVPLWEVTLSFLILLISVFYLRHIATRIFKAGMLYYGKEASWKQLWEWARSRQSSL